MIRPLTPVDIVRCIFLDEPGRSNRAYTFGSLVKAKPFSISLIEATRKGLSPRGKGCALVLRRGNRVLGLASASQRSGPQSWEITHLFVGAGAESQVPRLLDGVSQVAASHKCERVFLRLRRDDPLVDTVRLNGLFPRIPETLFKGTPPAGGPIPSGVSASLREKRHSDDHDLFRLYNAATPSEVRYAVGMTLEQWSSSRERPGGRPQEFVLLREDHARGWLRVSRRGGIGQLEATVHPQDEHAMQPIVDFGLERLRPSQAIYCLAPEYRVDLRSLLVDRGFEAVSDYITLVKSMAVTAKEGARVRAAMPSV